MEIVIIITFRGLHLILTTDNYKNVLDITGCYKTILSDLCLKK